MKIILRSSRVHSCALCAVAAWLGALSVAKGQEQGPEAFLDEIVVTAERREGILQTTPLSIVAFSGADLQEIGIGDIEELGSYVPNVSIGGFISGNNPNFVIRGIGQNHTSLGNDRGVGLYVDDVYFSPMANSLLSIVDVERVEVLRGPQGTLFGRNTTGGAIRYITRKPTDQLEGTVRATLGSFSRTDIRGIFNIPFADNFHGRFTAASLSRDGYVTQAVDGKDLGNQDERVFRAQLRWLPTDSVTVDLSASYVNFENNGDPQYIDGAVNSGALYLAYASLFPGTPPYSAVVDAPECETDLECTIPGSNWDEMTEGETTITTLGVQWDISDSLSFRSLTGATDISNTNRNDWDLSVLDIFHNGPSTLDWESFSQEFQLSGRGADDRLYWTAGLYFADEESSGEGGLAFYSYVGPRRPPPWPSRFIRLNADRGGSESTVENRGAFFDLTYDVSARFSVSAGVRYSADEKGLATSQRGLGPFSGSHEWSDTFGRLVLQFQPAETVMLYASYSEGYKAGAVADIIDPRKPNFGITPFDEETAQNAELGLRSDWVNGRLRLNLTLYDTDYANLQVTTREQPPAGSGGPPIPILGVANAGDVAMDGWELELIAAATGRLTFDLSFAKLNHEILSVAPSARSSITVDSILPRAPEDTWKAGLRYRVPLQGGASLRFGLDHAFTDEQKSFLTDANSTLLPDYGLTNARLTYAAPDDRWSVALYCTNCAGEYYITGQHFNRTHWGGSNTILGRPRMIGLEGTVNF